MRISDWSSDVCSSDLDCDRKPAAEPKHWRSAPGRRFRGAGASPSRPMGQDARLPFGLEAALRRSASRSPRGGRRASQARQSRLAEHLGPRRSEEHTSELQSLIRISYAVLCWKKKKNE